MDMATEPISHRLNLCERSRLTMTGVTEVISFDETAVVLQTGLGTLVVQGSQLQLKNLTQDGGQVEIDGTVDSLSYSDSTGSRGWLSRLFA